MPFLQASETKAIRNAIKAKYPTFKWSIATVHGTTLSVHVMAGPIRFDQDNFNVNHFWIDRQFKDKPTERRFFTYLLDLIREVKPCRTVTHDGDYGAVPNYYIHIEVGKWDKPYHCTT